VGKQKKWVVTLSQDRSASEVERALAETGLEIELSLAAIGVLTALGDDACAERARRVPGVADVAPDEPIDIGPPGSPDTW
jgi:hypothetical protein